MNVRTYEVSLWGLQDDFITVLKYANIETKGQIQSPKLKVNVDGTENFTFEIPMYIYRGMKRIENPIWYHVSNGELIADLRKIKLILNKTDKLEEKNKEKVYEFLITKVTETHDKDTLICAVECEGLAFHELGKVGYKISLSADAYNYELQDAYASASVIDTAGDIEKNFDIKPNIEYWLKKAGVKVWRDSWNSDTSSAEDDSDGKDEHGDLKIQRTKAWYYTVWMDYSAYPYLPSDDPTSTQGHPRDTTKIYEDAYIGSWTYNGPDNPLTPSAMVASQEKFRLIDLEESNLYNLTQDLAEKFGVFCRYQYDHDENYHITRRLIIFYNNFHREMTDGFLDITYPNTANKVERVMDGSNITTKLFIRPVNAENDENIDIIHVDANKSLEDYILNFDYLHDISSISEEQYEEISKYEQLMRHYNELLDKIAACQLAYNVDFPTYQAEETTLENAVKLDLEQCDQSRKLLQSITDGSDEIPIDQSNPDTAVLMNDAKNEGYFYLTLKRKGIEPETLHLYKTYEKTIQEGQQTGTFSLKDEFFGWEFEYDEARNPIKIRKIKKFNSGDRNIVYLAYKYKPKLYYERLQKYWEMKKSVDESRLAQVKIIVSKFRDILATLDTRYNETLKAKQKMMEYFERLMRPGLREGYWQPEDYKDYGDHFYNALKPTTYSYQKQVEQEVEGEVEKYICSTDDSQPYNINIKADFIWDNEYFDEEQLSYYNIAKLDAPDQQTQNSNNTLETWTREYYPIYNLNHIGTPLYNLISDHVDNMVFSFFPPDIVINYDNYNQRTVYTIGSQMEYGFVKAAYFNPLGTGGEEIYEQVGDNKEHAYVTYENAPCLILTGAKDSNLTTKDFIDHLKKAKTLPIITYSDFYTEWLNSLITPTSTGSTELIDNITTDIENRNNLLEYPIKYEDLDELPTEIKDKDGNVIAGCTYTINRKTETWFMGANNESGWQGNPYIDKAVNIKYNVDISIQCEYVKHDSSGDKTVTFPILFFLNGRLSDDDHQPKQSEQEDTIEHGTDVQYKDAFDQLKLAFNTREYAQPLNTFFYPNRVWKNNEGDVKTEKPQDSSNYHEIDNLNPMLYYPRIQVNSLKLKTSEDQLTLKMNNITRWDGYYQYPKLNNFEDYYVLSRSGLKKDSNGNNIIETCKISSREYIDDYGNKIIVPLIDPDGDDANYQESNDFSELINDSAYYITIKPKVFFEAGIIHTNAENKENQEATALQPINIHFVLSNADLAIYLDALKISKENAYPKIEYSITPTLYTTEYMQTAYNLLAHLININDLDLKFKNVTGYISGVELDLDHPDQDSFEVKNYKTKFEDLFSTISAQAQEMKKTQVSMDVASSAFTVQGFISPEVITGTFANQSVPMSWANGALSIDDNGLIATSSEGAVAFRNDGIFVATQRENEQWIWNEVITPAGISASTVGRGYLDTSRIRIFSGENVRFQMNEDGIFAYKSFMDDANEVTVINQWNYLKEHSAEQGELDTNQYVKFDEQGLSLVAKSGAYVLTQNTEDANKYWYINDGKLKIVPDEPSSGEYGIIKPKDKYYFMMPYGTDNKALMVERVKISWDGLTLRNWAGEEVFYADADTGNLTLAGTVYANGGYFGKEEDNNYNGWVIESGKEYQIEEKSSVAKWEKNDVINLASYTTTMENDERIVDSSTYVGLGGGKSNYALWAGSTQPIWFATNTPQLSDTPNHAPLLITKTGELYISDLILREISQIPIQVVKKTENWQNSISKTSQTLYAVYEASDGGGGASGTSTCNITYNTTNYILPLTSDNSSRLQGNISPKITINSGSTIVINGELWRTGTKATPNVTMQLTCFGSNEQNGETTISLGIPHEAITSDTYISAGVRSVSITLTNGTETNGTELQGFTGTICLQVSARSAQEEYHMRNITLQIYAPAADSEETTETNENLQLKVCELYYCP